MANEDMMGTGAYAGKKWDGHQWIDATSEEIAAAGGPAITASATWTPPAADPIARRLTGVIYGLLAVLCAVAALSMQPVFGRDAGGMVMLVALAAAGGFGIAALVKA